jgi:light-regulated signal transduction histidine kinase (bacteriophytochrome)
MVFEVFQRLYSKSSYSGPGIGLSVVDKIVKQHNGYVKAEGEKEGSTFTVYLPLE